MGNQFSFNDKKGSKLSSLKSNDNSKGKLSPSSQLSDLKNVPASVTRGNNKGPSGDDPFKNVPPTKNPSIKNKE